MKRQKQAQNLNKEIKEFLKKNPAIKKALRVFGISYEQYQKALESSYNFYTDTSTSPKEIKFRNKK